ncbi:SDR family oxidoreductase [Aquabacter sp. CN5-332]|uniref:SDR family oxidoreductase n=1 Tax=Aquabacter sp. CN5-332 TaxID=3156608 RepID=UPI0032B51CC3
MSRWTVSDIPSQVGRLAVVTGATGGLGFETALGLAGAGAEVILAARNPEKGKAAVSAIKAKVPDAKVSFGLLDLSSLASVEAFARTLLAGRAALDLLVNNAAVMSLPRRHETADGFEMQLGTNYLGHFALTGRLMPLLRKAERARVVNLSSLAHRAGAIELADLQSNIRYRPWAAYQQSKLAMLMFAFELQRRSDMGGWRITSTAAHPGWARTDLIANGPRSEGGFSGTWILSKVMAPLFSHSAAGGALPTLFAATSPQAETGGYYGPNGFYEMKGAVAPSFVAPQARNEVVASRLWEESERLTGVSFTLPAMASVA